MRRLKPTHVSIVGGEPLVRFRELDEILPKLAANGVQVQVVTSAVRPIPEHWAKIPDLQICVSIDGLRARARRAARAGDLRSHPEAHQRTPDHRALHDHAPADAAGLRRRSSPSSGTRNPDVKGIWFSLYTPQKGEESPERLLPEDRARVVAEIAGLRERLPKLRDMRPSVLQGYLHPPKDPAACIFAQTTACLSADLTEASRRASSAAIRIAASAGAWRRPGSTRSAATSCRGSASRPASCSGCRRKSATACGSCAESNWQQTTSNSQLATNNSQLELASELQVVVAGCRVA